MWVMVRATPWVSFTVHIAACKAARRHRYLLDANAALPLTLYTSLERLGLEKPTICKSYFVNFHFNHFRLLCRCYRSSGLICILTPRSGRGAPFTRGFPLQSLPRPRTVPTGEQPASRDLCLFSLQWNKVAFVCRGSDWSGKPRVKAYLYPHLLNRPWKTLCRPFRALWRGGSVPRPDGLGYDIPALRALGHAYS